MMEIQPLFGAVLIATQKISAYLQRIVVLANICIHSYNTIRNCTN